MPGLPVKEAKVEKAATAARVQPEQAVLPAEPEAKAEMAVMVETAATVVLLVKPATVYV